MLRSFLVRLFCGVFAIGALTSCGGGGAGTTEFATVFATANPAVSGLQSDVAKWVDSTGAKASPCVTGSRPTQISDFINYTITSTAYPVPNTSSTTTTSPVLTSNLLITDITVTLTPYNPSHDPALPAQYQTEHSSPGQLVIPGTTTIPVTIATDELKLFLRTASATITAPLNCSNVTGMYSYWAVVTFTASEVNTGKVGTMTAPALKVDFADFND